MHPRRITKDIFIAAQQCPKKAFFAHLADSALQRMRDSQKQRDIVSQQLQQEAQQRSDKVDKFFDSVLEERGKALKLFAELFDWSSLEKRCSPSSSSSSASSSSIDDEPCFAPAVDGGDGMSGSSRGALLRTGSGQVDDTIAGLKTQHLHAFARRWHTMMFASKERTFHVAGAGRNKQVSRTFDESCALTQQLIETHVLNVAPLERRPFAIHGAAFAARVAAAAGGGVELRATCDLLHYVPPGAEECSIHADLQKQQANKKKSSGGGDAAAKKKTKSSNSKNKEEDTLVVESMRLSSNSGSKESSSSSSTQSCSADGDNEGHWELIEIRSAVEASKVVDTRTLHDLGYQRFILSENGVRIRAAGVLHPSRRHIRVPTYLDVPSSGIVKAFFQLEPVKLFGPVEAVVAESKSTKKSNSSKSNKKSQPKSQQQQQQFDGEPETDVDAVRVSANKVVQLLWPSDSSSSSSKDWNLHFGNCDDSNSNSNNSFEQVCKQESICGSQCTSPHPCPFLELCVPSQSQVPYSVWNLPHFNMKKKAELWNRGVRTAAELVSVSSKQQKSNNGNNSKNNTAIEWSAITATTNKALVDLGSSFSSSQLRFAYACAAQKPVISTADICAFLDEIKYPLIALDFEASQFAMPPLKNYEAYEHIPFQFSAHVVESEKDLLSKSSSSTSLSSRCKHREFIHMSSELVRSKAIRYDDPRPLIAKALVDLFKEFSDPATADGESGQPLFCGSVVCHNASFEARILTRLANLFPEIFPKMLRPSKIKFIDTMDLVRRGVILPQAGGSASLKKVLPLLAQDEEIKQAYDSSAGHLVVDGSLASGLYWMLKMGVEPSAAVIGGSSSGVDPIDKLRSEMLRYCAMDSVGTLEIIRACAAFVGRVK